VLDRLNLVNPDLREFLINKWKFCCEELSHTSPYRCEQAGCQLVMVHSVHYQLGPVPMKPQKKNKARNLQDLPSASVNMIGRGREPLRARRGRHDTNSFSFSSPDSDYNPSLGQVLVGQEGEF